MTAYEQFIQTLIDYLHDNAVKIVTGIILMALGWYFGRIRAAIYWRKQEFLDRLNVSLNTLDYATPDGGVNNVLKLKIRTLSEKRCEEVFLNVAAADNIKKYAKLTTAQNPILPIPQADVWFYLNSVLNDLSEQFAQGLLKKDMGGGVLYKTYLIALTCESAGELKTRKIRAMVIQKDYLTNLPPDMPALESPHHVTRWETLKRMAIEYKNNPDQFLEVVLAV